jgi:hypothetical protein
MEEAKKERRIPKSGEGRLRYQRGDPHALNVQTKEARRVAEQLSDAAQQVPELLAGLQEHQQVPERLVAEDEALAVFLLGHYAKRKHVDHIQETLLIFRRKRALARIQAAQVALALAQELLAPDPLIPDLIALLQAGSGPMFQAEVDRERLTGSPRLLDTQLVEVKERLHIIQAALTQGNGWIEC